ncbi:MAG: hypothetical protein KatS3mg113_0069 [Planctomycetaceae bacterium]|nr:MAG: hypothetical protein KatS3mg113_0069 [Planctomycetaceae bacterium]
MIDKKKIWNSSQLPTLPTVAVRLLELSRDPESEMREFIAAIKSDPAITAKIIKAANSSYFGLRQEVKSVERAVPLLGTTVATSLALSFSLSEAAMARGPLAAHYRDYWEQSLVQAAAMEVLAQRIAPAQTAEFFLCGLIQDLGRLAMLKTIPQEYLPVLEEAVAATELSLFDLELQHLETTHVEIGRELLERWKFPQDIHKAVQLHHASVTQLTSSRSAKEFKLWGASAIAASVGEYFCTQRRGLSLHRLRQLTAELFQLDAASLDSYLQQCMVRIRMAADLFDVDVSNLADPAELMVEANEQLAQLALKEHIARTQAHQEQQEIEKQKRVLEEKARQLELQAHIDSLTGLYNRRYFEDAMKREVAKAVRSAQPLGILMIDVDHFKSINDTYGHPCGDSALQHVSTLLRDTVRKADVLARYGGEEFVILMAHPSERGLEILAERIRSSMERAPLHWLDQVLSITCSIGTAITIPGRNDHEVGQVLLSVADNALYEAKRTGRNRVVNQSLLSETQRRLIQKVTEFRFSRWLVAQKLLDVHKVTNALLECPVHQSPVGELAIEWNYLTREQVQQILAEQQHVSERFGSLAIQKGWLTEAQLIALLAWQQEHPKHLAGILVRQGALSPTAAIAALEAYLQQYRQLNRMAEKNEQMAAQVR